LDPGTGNGHFPGKGRGKKNRRYQHCAPHEPQPAPATLNMPTGREDREEPEGYLSDSASGTQAMNAEETIPADNHDEAKTETDGTSKSGEDMEVDKVVVKTENGTQNNEGAEPANVFPIITHSHWKGGVPAPATITTPTTKRMRPVSMELARADSAKRPHPLRGREIDELLRLPLSELLSIAATTKDGANVRKMALALMIHLAGKKVRNIGPCATCKEGVLRIPPRVSPSTALARLTCSKKECGHKVTGTKVLNSILQNKKELMAQVTAPSAALQPAAMAQQNPGNQQPQATLGAIQKNPQQDQERKLTETARNGTSPPDKEQVPASEQIAILVKERNDLHAQVLRLRSVQLDLEDTVAQQMEAVDASKHRIHELESQVESLRATLQRTARTAARELTLTHDTAIFPAMPSHPDYMAMHHRPQAQHHLAGPWNGHHPKEIQGGPRPPGVQQAIEEGLKTITKAIAHSREDRKKKRRVQNSGRGATASRLPDEERPKNLTTYYFTSTAAIPFRSIKNSVGPILRQLPIPVPTTALVTMDWFPGQGTHVLEVIMDKDHENPIAQAMRDLQYRHWPGASPFDTFTPRALHPPTIQTVEESITRLQKHAHNQKAHATIQEHYNWLLERTREAKGILERKQNSQNLPRNPTHEQDERNN